MSLALGSKEGDTAAFYHAKKKARISITIQLSFGPLCLPNVEFLSFVESMNEFILSQTVLTSLGFDLDKHLSSVLNTIHDADFSHIASTTA